MTEHGPGSIRTEVGGWLGQRLSEPADGWTVPEHDHSHLGLLGEGIGAVGNPGPPLDAIVVPAARPAGNLSSAAATAASLETWFLVLASHRTDVAQAWNIAVERGVLHARLAIVQVPDDWALEHWPYPIVLDADRRPQTVERRSNTSAKRNAGIAIARMCGWKRILFLDDDVSGVDAAEAARIRVALADDSPWEAGGYRCRSFPDNSELCHAVALAGGAQEQFIGAGALAVKVSESTPHFPRVYNEDWLFMLPMLERRDVSIVLLGELAQDELSIFSDPATADLQEWGDVLAEGLYHHLHLGCPIEDTESPDYWREIIGRRNVLSEKLLSILSGRGGDETARKACAALRRAAALRADGEAWSAQLAGWVTSWRRDAAAWAQYLGDLPVGLSIDQALSSLGCYRYQGRRKPERQIMGLPASVAVGEHGWGEDLPARYRLVANRTSRRLS